MPLFLLLFVVLPLAEIATFIQVGGWIGLTPTLLTILGSAVIGILLVRVQGLSTLQRAREAMARDEPPVREMTEGLCLFVAGILLVVPGFLTDLVGLLLLVPQIRSWVAWRLWRNMQRHGTVFVATGAAGASVRRPTGPAPGARPRPGPPPRGTVIEGEFEDITGREDAHPDAGADELPPPESRWGDRKD